MGYAFMTDCSNTVVDCLRVSVTDRCNLRCVYCMPPRSIGCASHHNVLRFQEIVEVARFLREQYGLRTVRLTGGDPLMRPHIVVLVGMLSRMGVDDLALTTNGQQLSALAGDLREAGVDRVNISLDSLNRARFSRLTRGGRLDRTLAGIEAARAAGFVSVKINTVVLRGENDSEVCDLVRFAMARGLEIRFLEMMAIGISAKRHATWFVPSRHVLGRLTEKFRLVALGATPDNRTQVYLAEDGRGNAARVGFISPETRPFCGNCRRLRLSCDGYLFGCLRHSRGVGLLELLRRPDGPDYEGLDRSIRAALAAKHLPRARSSARLMAAIGG